jgi:hypothetical protein
MHVGMPVVVAVEPTHAPQAVPAADQSKLAQSVHWEALELPVLATPRPAGQSVHDGAAAVSEY